MRDFQRGAIRLHILHHAAEHDIHGAWMTRELAGHGYDISPGTLYPTLHRLEADGLLASRQEIIEGRTRRLYHATNAGRAVLAADRAALAELAHEVLGTTSPTPTSTHHRSPGHDHGDPEHQPSGHDGTADTNATAGPDTSRATGHHPPTRPPSR